MEWREEEGKEEHIKKKGMKGRQKHTYSKKEMKIDKVTEDNMGDRRNILIEEKDRKMWKNKESDTPAF